MAHVVTVVLSVAALLNVVASLAANRCFSLSPRQRLLQHALIWLVPFVGAIVSLVFVRQASRDPFAPQELELKPGEGGVYHDTDGFIPGSGSD